MVESRLIYAVEEENYGVIAVADKLTSAVEMLITSGWVNAGTVVCYYREQEYISVGEAMERFGYGDALQDFIADMLENKIKGYTWDFCFRTISFYEEV